MGVGLSMGHRYSLILISHVKVVLQHELSPEWRLQFLEHLEKMQDGALTPAVIALVEPMDKQGMELLEEARKLGYRGSPPNFFTVLDKKFDAFALLNPSLVRAYDEACRPWGDKYEDRANAP
jgi:hypothetical protein